MRQKGFTLVELIIIIVVLGILLPVIFLPFLTASKGVAYPTVSASMGAVARSVMEQELVRIDTVAWPPSAPSIPAPVTLNGTAYSSTITEKFCDDSSLLNPLSAACTNANPGTSNYYLQVQVTTSGGGSSSITIETIKSHDF